MPKLEEGIDYYLENGKYVFTQHFLKNRGYCCDNGCRHCPYREEAKRDIKYPDDKELNGKTEGKA